MVSPEPALPSTPTGDPSDPRAADASAAAPEELPADCALARQRILRFLAGAAGDRLRKREDRGLREHLARCVACAEVYRSEAVLVARLGRGARRRTTRSRGPTAAAKLAGTSRASASLAARRLPLPPVRRRVRIVMLPALGLLLVLALRGFPDFGRPRGFEVLALAGHVRVAELPVGPADEALALRQGSLCSTGAGRALIQLDSTRLFVESGSEIVLGSARDRRFHLGQGGVVARGPCAVVLWDGIVEVPQGAAAHITTGANGTDVAGLEGRVAIGNAAERRELASGEHATLSP